MPQSITINIRNFKREIFSKYTMYTGVKHFEQEMILLAYI